MGGTTASTTQNPPMRTAARTPSTRPTTTEIQTIFRGSRSIWAMSTSSENPSIHRQLRRLCFLVPTAARSASTSFRRSTATSSSGSVTNSPRRATSALFERRLQQRADREVAEPEHEDDDERDQDPGLEQTVAELGCVRPAGAGRGAVVREGDGLGADDGDLDVDALVGASIRAVAQEVLVAELEAELVVDLRQAVRGARRRVAAARVFRDALEVVRRRSRTTRSRP